MKKDAAMVLANFQKRYPQCNLPFDYCGTETFDYTKEYVNIEFFF
jgi:hypothetical protein